MLDLNSIIEQMQRNCLEWSEDSSALSLIRNLDFQVHISTKTICVMNCFSYKMMNLINSLQLLEKLSWIIFVLQQQDKSKRYFREKCIIISRIDKGNSNGTTSKFCFRKGVWIFDRYIMEKPSATTLNLESTILFETNFFLA